MDRTVDPDQIGLDPRRPAVLDPHFACYVDDGLPAGWQLAGSSAPTRSATGCLSSRTYGSSSKARSTPRSRALYRRVGFDMGTVTDGDLADACRACAALPLLFQPGTAWGYSVATLPTSSAG